MADSEKPPIGSISWRDLTVQNADAVRDFYAKVVGWTHSPVEMGGCSDYCMNRPDGVTEAGICHARGPNAKIPPQWLMYITVADPAASAKKCVELGGKIIDGPRSVGEHTFYVIQDAAGVVAGVIG